MTDEKLPRRLRGIVAYSANGDGDYDRTTLNETDRWYQTYTAQEAARERLRNERAQAGGDESIFGIIDAEDIGDPEPVALSVGGLLLSTGVHRINGPAGSGKTRLAYWEILQRVKNGDRWAIFDKEMGPERYKQAMVQLGATEKDLAMIDYIITRDDVTPDLIRHGRALCRVCLEHNCVGILYDSQTPFLAASGVNENDPQGIRAWTDAAARPMAAAGGTAIVLDHTGHDEPERGRGSSDKAAGCDVDMFLSPIAPFARGIDGILGLTIAKDRSGTLQNGSSVRISVRCYDSGDVDFDPENWIIYAGEDIDVAEILALLLIDIGLDFATASELQEKIPGRKQNKLAAIEKAVRNMEIIKMKKGSAYHYMLPEGK